MIEPWLRIGERGEEMEGQRRVVHFELFEARFRQDSDEKSR
jgi:hypothetical protein